MYLVEIGSGRPMKEQEVEAVVAVPLSPKYRERPVRSLEEIEAEANQGDQSGLDVVIGNYRKEAGGSFDFSTLFEVVIYAYQRIRSYLR